MYLLSLLKDPKPLVRQITCWTLGRYSRWASELPPEQRVQFFEPLMQGLLSTVLDKNKRVQEAGCSAFANLEEQAADVGPVLLPYVEHILQNFSIALSRFQRKNLIILCDAIQTLADGIGEAFNNPTYLQLVVPQLIQKWFTLSAEKKQVCFILECLSSICVAAGDGMLPYAEQIYKGSIDLMTQIINDEQNYLIDPSMDPPDTDDLIGALDLVSGLVQGLKSNAPHLISSSNVSIFQPLIICIRHEVPDVRQSAYALIGDLAMTAMPLMEPYMGNIMPALLNEIDAKNESVSVCNNAIWSLGEIALKIGNRLEPWADEIIPRLLSVLFDAGSAPALVENASITLGRMGFGLAEKLSPELDKFASKFCLSLCSVRDNDEKDSAFLGFCMIVQRNPNGLLKHIGPFVLAVAKFDQPSPQLEEMFGKVKLIID